jgi:starch phosphorylase
MLTDGLRYGDHYMIAADFDSYWEAQRQVDAVWREPEEWARMCIRNIAGMGWFSADRAIGDYAKSVWHARF